MIILTITIASTFLAVAGPTHAEPSNWISVVQSEGNRIVQQLRELPTPLPSSGSRDDPIEKRRRELYRQLRQLGDDVLPALARGLSDPDVQIRRNVALVHGLLAGGTWREMQPPLDIRACLPALIAALQDRDSNVRGWAAQAIGEIGPNAAQAVSALVRLLKDSDEGSRNSACIALRCIGPAAKEALPALRQALADPSADVRRFAQWAIVMIQGEQKSTAP